MECCCFLRFVVIAVDLKWNKCNSGENAKYSDRVPGVGTGN